MINHPEHDERLDRLISPDAVEGLYTAALWAVAARRGVPPDRVGPSGRTEALQRLYRAGFERGVREERSRYTDDGK